MAKKGDKRCFQFVVYLDSAPDDWLLQIRKLISRVWVSPLHDQDKKDDGTFKKPHHHVMIYFDNAQTPERVMDEWLPSNIPFAVFPKSLFLFNQECVVNSIRGAGRYLCHLDNPEKAQYSIEYVHAFGDWDFSDLCLANKSDRYVYITYMTDYIRDNEITSYFKFFDYCKYNNFEWFKLLCDGGSYVIEKYIKSYAWTLQNDI